MGNGPFKLKGWSPFTKTSPAKDKEANKEHTEAQKHNTEGEHVNQYGETPEQYKERMSEMGLRSVSDAKTKEEKEKAATELFE